MLARCPLSVFDMSNVSGVGSAPVFKFVCVTVLTLGPVALR